MDDAACVTAKLRELRQEISRIDLSSSSTGLYPPKAPIFYSIPPTSAHGDLPPLNSFCKKEYTPLHLAQH